MKLISWDAHNINDGTNYQAVLDAGVYGLPTVDPILGMRQGSWPIFAGLTRPGKIIHINIYIRGASVSTLQKQLAQWFDPDDQDPKRLVGEDTSGANDRYINGVCVQLVEVPFSAGLHYVASIQVDGDVMWREITPTTASSWSITASGQTKVVANGGEMDCYPIITIEPTGNKTGSWNYKRFIPVIWKATSGASNYPVDIVNDGLDTQIASTNFSLANGDDLRVWVNGAEVDRWLDGPNTSTTKVWVNLSFSPQVDVQLAAAIGTGDTTITVNDDIDSMPNTGIIRIDSEVITYASKSNAARSFIGCTRGAKGTTAASHTLMTQVYWVQHDIWILYGNSSAGTAPASAAKKPMIETTSTNLSWDFNEFGADTYYQRSAQWYQVGDGTQYGGNQGAAADPWIELGLNIYFDDIGAMAFYNPCGISSANFVNGERYGPKALGEEWWIKSSPNGSTWTNEYQLANVAFAYVWESWSRNETLAFGAKYVAMWIKGATATVNHYMEAADVTLALNSTYTPTVSIGAEQNSYLLDCIITNNTTGDAIGILFSMQRNEELEINTDEKTLIYLDDNSNQFQALTVEGDPRRDWIPLAPGNNTLQFDDTGTTAVTVTISYEERYYQ